MLVPRGQQLPLSREHAKKTTAAASLIYAISIWLLPAIIAITFHEAADAFVLGLSDVALVIPSQHDRDERQCCHDAGADHDGLFDRLALVPLDDFDERVWRGFQEIVAAHPDERVMAVAHGGVIGQLLHRVTGSRRFAFSGADNASISEIVASPERIILRRYNDVSHLLPLLNG